MSSEGNERAARAALSPVSCCFPPEITLRLTLRPPRPALQRFVWFANSVFACRLTPAAWKNNRPQAVTVDGVHQLAETVLPFTKAVAPRAISMPSCA